MNEQEILKKVQDIVVDELDVDAADVTLEADIKDDLDADSLDVFEIMNELEDDLDIKLEASEDVKTIQDVVNYVKKEIDAKAE
ncbi:acyl carrier protein [Ligilactobacillus acidipiscis]|jgi:acyl carrier protein|nr:acyl carrier protein [Ligilactobacillus acidipiscis]MCI1954242.1 acyl carrier protein [Ligilactobacillus acidipiscis]WEV56077.1 acyl carrier protein [Ligilactobacillus acidipiscis]SFV40946.1 Acyl carrier protein [Ligilactobacillus acidipiscis]GAW65172.1 acyl carrier protein [Ligilactobacillus acidipiscis]GEN20945.1 acyl carrier protein [Ligilactobacillus acidipiscis]